MHNFNELKTRWKIHRNHSNLLRGTFILLVTVVIFSELNLVGCQMNENNNNWQQNRPRGGNRRRKTTLSPTTIKETEPLTTITQDPFADDSTIPLTGTTVDPLAPVTPNITEHDHHIKSPFTYSTELLNKTHANMFKSWLDTKSEELYELSMNFSGYKLINETYNLKLRQDAQFAWINFTSMIMNISDTISEVLLNKTLVVKKLSDLVEKTYDEFRNDSDQIEEAAGFLYYDSKSPKTFCDLQEAIRLRRNITEESEAELTTEAVTTTTSTTPTTLDPGEITTPLMNPGPSLDELKFTGAPDNFYRPSTPFGAQQFLMQLGTPQTGAPNYSAIRYNLKEEVFQVKESEDLVKTAVATTKKSNTNIEFEFILRPNELATTTKACVNVNPFYKEFPKSYPSYHRRHKRRHHRAKRQDDDPDKKPKRRRRPGQARNGTRRRTKKQRKTTTPSTLIYDEEERADLDFYDDYFMQNLQEKPFWNITCINRTFDENFKNFPKGVNRNKSTIHVPINVYKQDMNINITAYWTETLNNQFTKNYDEDNELFWQYFCSSHGLLRRYPGALWTVPHREDFFDCRLQSWYIMAAASPKDVLILMDSSGSMTGLRLEIAKKLIESIMDTLSDNDFFNILTYSNTVNYLMNLKNETAYRGRFIQAGKDNKLRFMEKLKEFKNTHEVANLDEALKASFYLLLNKHLNEESCKCNKVIMVITDGASENGEEVFKKYNWNNGRRVRVFTFLIGRDNVDQRQVQWMACANDGQFFHVATIADVNEHVHEYIPVLSRPMALQGTHETTWSNVFIGHLDKELKIAVARPAFKTQKSLLAKSEVKFVRNPIARIPEPTTKGPVLYDEYEDYSDYEDYYEYYEEEEEDVFMPKPKRVMTAEETKKFEHQVQESLKEQQVLLGVVGVDVPVLRLISKVSPKFQMGVGIYIIMLDNNGFIVFHPSIKRTLSTAAVDSKGTSQSIDIDKFEIPINNTEEFQKLEHEMIDEHTNNITLENWKREGLRVTRRKTEYVYTSVHDSPFSVAIASPNSFGRFYIDLPPSKEYEYTKHIVKLVEDGNVYETLVSVYNCSYSFKKLTKKITNPALYSDFCIKYLFQDTSQVLAIKSDLVLHDVIYNIFNFSIFDAHPNLVRSSFYGTFSGITFYMPVKFFVISPEEENIKKKKGKKGKGKGKTLRTTTTTTTTTTTEYGPYRMTGPPSEMTIDAKLVNAWWKWPSSKPHYQQTSSRVDGRPMSFNNSQMTLNNNLSNLTYYHSANLFSMESMKHTYSFEKEYYTRSIEFSDYMRNSHNHTDPIVVYFLNDTQDVNVRRDTVSATLPIWLDKVPTAVTGVTYNAKLLQNVLFENYMLPDCDHESCRNLCSKDRGMNVTCYLVDEHGIVVLSTMKHLFPPFFKDRGSPMGQPLYKVNPWLMKQLEYDGIYQLVIPGPTLPECRKPSIQFNSASSITGFIILIVSNVINMFQFLVQQVVFLFSAKFILDLTPQTNFLIEPVDAQSLRNITLVERIEMFNNDWRIQNSHCFYFGIYSFNITKWKSLDSSEYRIWCNSTAGAHLGKEPQPRHYLAGYIKHSNLLMLVVEDEFELIHCGNMSSFIKKRTEPPVPSINLTNTTNITVPIPFELDTLSEDEESPRQKQKKKDDISIVRVHDYDIDFIYELNFTNYTNFTNLVQHPQDYSINRYRRRPSHCNNIFPNEKEYLPCSSSANKLLAPITSSSVLFYLFAFSYGVREAAS